MKIIKNGIKGNAEMTVSANDLASAVGSGSLNVLATPIMTSLMEKAACSCIADYLENDETTVGIELNIKHNSPTPLGMKVSAEAVLTDIDGRLFTFSVRAMDEVDIIGEGIHKRVLVYGHRFTEKANSKK